MSADNYDWLFWQKFDVSIALKRLELAGCVLDLIKFVVQPRPLTSRDNLDSVNFLLASITQLTEQKGDKKLIQYKRYAQEALECLSKDV